MSIGKQRVEQLTIRAALKCTPPVGERIALTLDIELPLSMVSFVIALVRGIEKTFVFTILPQAVGYRNY